MNTIDNDNQKKIINELDILIYAFYPACTSSEAIVKNKVFGLNYWLTLLIKTLLDSIKEESLKISNNRKWDEISEKSISKEISNKLSIIEKKIEDLRSFKEMCLKEEKIPYKINNEEKSFVNSSNKPLETPNPKQTRIYNKYTKQTSNYKKDIFRNALLYDRYFWNFAKLVTRNKENIKVYYISWHYRFNQRIYYVAVKNRWIKIENIANKLKKEGIVYGTFNIIRALRIRNSARYDKETKIQLETEEDDSTYKSLKRNDVDMN